MRKQLMISLLVLFSGVLAGCDEDAGQAESTACSTECRSGESCVDGVCMCGNSICTEGQICENNRCQNKACEGDECDVKECSPVCSESESCVDGVCKCGDSVCQNGQICVEDSCIERSECTPECTGDSSCVDGVCKCGNSLCGETQICRSGICENISNCEPECFDDSVCTDGQCLCGGIACDDGYECIGSVCEEIVLSDDEEEVCEPQCGENQVCSDGECIEDTPDPVCSPECAENMICTFDGCKEVETFDCSGCSDSEKCVEGVCMCGSSVCADEEVCRSGKCEVIDPCGGDCAPEVCIAGKCEDSELFFNKSKMDVCLSSKSDKLIATRKSSKNLTWTISGKDSDGKLQVWDANAEMSKVRCIVSTNKYSKKLSDCIKIDDSAKTETIQFVNLARKSTEMTVKVKDSKGNEVSAELNLKPYFDDDNFVKLDKKTVGSTLLRYKNGITPGEKLSSSNYTVKSSATGDAKYKYTDKTETTAEEYANLCGNKNSYCRTTFGESDTKVFDEGLYRDYVLPNLIVLKKDDGKKVYYGTRASVVAAARFLILQFPYDIPYALGGSNNTKVGRGHYVWAYNDLKSKTEDARVLGLNLVSKSYYKSLDHGHYLTNTNIPWGAWDSSIPHDEQKGGYYKNNPDFLFNGLECSGFVNWALNNGRVSLGDWTTHMFSKDGFCEKSGEIVRNYRCKDVVNHTTKEKSVKNASWGSSRSNKNNSLVNAYDKLKLLENGDFHKLDGKSASDVKTIINGAKAGDLLWRGEIIKKDDITKSGVTPVDNKYYGGGHVAMIIGLERDSKGNVTDLYVGEAISRSGNSLTHFTMKDIDKTDGSEEPCYLSNFTKSSTWVKTSNFASFLIDMTKVYEYNTTKLKEECKTNNCSDTVKKAIEQGCNAYKYSEEINKKFADVIGRRRFETEGLSSTCKKFVD